ncbi:ceruloplasmin [Sinocyclocheilus rhinocerous]|uniref:ferroxidase n=1 Tax=Sinocyclocheilus rhinocerous TaxID=307959 RepID=A0A673KTT7_9TELE|nr:PREDICTED: ceruloplasmin [Sinocyclocheilus rhinocerous]
MKGLQWTLLGALCCAGIASSITREYFFAIKEIQWDYAPSGTNLIQNKTIEEDEEARVFLERGEQRIGRLYKKAVYLQYTDATYRQEIEKPKWLGYLGPLISAEEDDVVIVHLKNMARREYSIHAHGLSYNKSNEGALYPDSSEKVEKADDSVAPGKSFTYVWTLPASHTPGKDDTNCLTRIYHSHVKAPRDIASGLIGPLIICKKGSLDVHGDKTADYLYTLMFTVSDENLSWYLDENIRTYCTAPAKVNKDDEGFQESNKMHSINGYVYGNLPDLSMCMGNKIHWHLFGMGNEVDLHSAFFHGQILTDKRHHVDTVSLFPATFVNVEMVADNPGQWLLSCQVNDHLEAGMQAIFEIKKCFPNVHKPRPFGEVRQYYIAAEEIIWDYGPTGINQYSGKKLADDSVSDTFFDNRNDRIGGKYKKVQYMEYTDDTFSKRKERTPEEQHLGILGPIIRAEEEDTIKVTFRNKASRPYSIQPHGVQYNIEMDGTLYHNVLEESYTAKKLRELKKEARVVEPLPAALVRPDSTYQYEWLVPKDGGPTEKDPDCITYLYYSAVDPIRDTNSGLVGPLLICKPKTLKSGKQKNVDKEFHLLATVFDENLSWHLDDNINRSAKKPKSVNKEDEDFQESNKMHSLNGYMYGNLKGLSMCKGDKVSWHLSGLGSEVDIHGLYFEGNRFLYKDTRRDTINVFPHISHTVIMEPDSMGQFEVGCKTTDHYHGGMRANYTVEKCRFWNRQSETMLHQKKYYIAAVEMDWDYSPTRTWEEQMHHGLKDSPGNEFLKKEGKFIGSKYKKVLYREYTDDTFTKPKERSADMEHLGIMGPMIHGKVGEKVKIVFKNMAKRPYSIHAHGVKTDSPQVALTRPGQTQTYTWYLPKNSGPTEEQEECSVGAYYSTVDVIKDMYSGLIGPLVICKKSLARTLGLKKEIEEFALLFMVFDENESWYLDDNIKAHVKNPPKALKEDEEFIESNKMHGINGLVYGNLKGLNMKVGDKVYWYLMGMGNEVDIHTAHFHGHSFDYKVSGTHRADVFDLFPGTFQTVTMRPLYSGNWLLHCHVTDHIQAGMETTYTVLEKNGRKRGFLGLFGSG